LLLHQQQNNITSEGREAVSEGPSAQEQQIKVVIQTDKTTMQKA